MLGQETSCWALSNRVSLQNFLVPTKTVPKVLTSLDSTLVAALEHTFRVTCPGFS